MFWPLHFAAISGLTTDEVAVLVAPNSKVPALPIGRSEHVPSPSGSKEKNTSFRSD